MPLDHQASTLQEFHDGLAAVSTASFAYHFLASRLRLHLKTNDFSEWLAGSLGLHTLADRIGRIDIYTNTMDSARAKMLTLVERELRR